MTARAAAELGWGLMWTPVVTWAKLVRKSAGLVDGFENVVKIVGDGVGGTDGACLAWIWMVR